jgi:hypothetical protein
MKLSKAQTQTITLVLIAGIVVSLSSAAYLWGRPLIEKSTTINDFAAAKRFILDLDSKIRDVANSGSGKLSVSAPSGGISVIPYDPGDPMNKSKNAVILEFVVSQPMIFNSSAPLETWSLEEVASYERDEPRIIMLTGEPFGQGYKLMISLHYRELDTGERPLRGYRIALSQGTSTGGNDVTVEFDRNVVEPAQAENNGDLVISYVKVSAV